MRHDLAALRNEFPIMANGIYLNSAGRGPLPRAHVAATAGFLHDMSERMTPGDFRGVDRCDARACRAIAWLWTGCRGPAGKYVAGAEPGARRA